MIVSYGLVATLFGRRNQRESEEFKHSALQVGAAECDWGGERSGLIYCLTVSVGYRDRQLCVLLGEKCLLVLHPDGVWPVPGVIFLI